MTSGDNQVELAPEVKLSVLILHYFEAQDRITELNTEGNVPFGMQETWQIRKQIEQLIKGQE